MVFSQMNYVKNFNVVDASLEELQFFHVQLDGIVGSYEKLSYEVPEWLTLKTRDAKRRIVDLTFEEKAARLKKLQLRRGSLMTVDEKRNVMDTEIEQLKKELGE